MLKIYIHFNEVSKSYAKLRQGGDNSCHIKSSVSIQKLQLENKDTKKKKKRGKKGGNWVSLKGRNGSLMKGSASEAKRIN